MDTTTIKDEAIKRTVVDLIKISKLTDQHFARLFSLTASALSKDYLYYDWVFPFQNEIVGSKHGFTTFLTTLNDTVSTTGIKGQELENIKPSHYVEMITALSATKYDQACALICSIFKGYFSWDDFEFNWTFIEPDGQKTWPLENVLKPSIPESIIGVSGYLYKHVSDGIQRITFSTSSFKNEKGFYTAVLLEKQEMDDPYHPSSSKYEGVVFSDVRSNDNKIILLLKNVQSEMYAHLILFANKGDRPEKQTVFVGHFTYYTLTRGVNKYLTKQVILNLAVGISPNQLQPLRILTKERNSATQEEQVSNSEKYIRRYLSRRERSRLTSIRSSLISIDDLKDWIKLRSPHRDLLKSYANKSYYVFYIKRIPAAEGDVPLKFYQDKLTLSSDIAPEYLEASYQHYAYDSSYTVHSNDNDRELSDHYEGRFFRSNNFLYGLLLNQKQKDPLYLIMHIDPKGYHKSFECFLGSVAAARDETRSLAVTYSCVLVPTTKLGTGKAATATVKIIESYLKNEATMGWGIVDPPIELISKYSIDGLKRSGKSSTATTDQNTITNDPPKNDVQ